ncbi:hypothetical protein EG329_000479 [Mollisiaceae sp. DMI_Dod_QoI]|nr:hypothetical protein EG329_000479 [Helotiales sp. DMI_Dod_QoI]
MPPSVHDYDLDRGDQLVQTNFGEAEAGSSFQNGASDNQLRPSYSAKPNPDYIPFLERLRRIPSVREIPWRPGQELPPEKAEDSPRVQQRGAILLSTRGKVMELKCTADGRALRYHTENPDALQSYIRSVGDSPPKPTKKRKRRSGPAPANPPHNPSYSSGQRLDSPTPASPDLDTILQAEIAREEDSGQQEYATTVERKPKRQQYIAQQVAAPEVPAKTSSWTAANLPSTEALSNSSKSRDAAPMAAGRWAAVKEQRSITPGSADLPDQIAKGSSSGPLIDTFPKAKQRQIYGVVSGLQGGIEHLNSQVASLKALLGIDAEDSRP